MNTFGNIFTLTTFGESHGAAIGGVIDGMPAGVDVDMAFIQSELARRRPGQSKITTSRNETDEVELLSGVFEGKTTGTPIGFIVRNRNQHSKDYDNMRHLFRPSHADYTYQFKYGIRDHRGGGRSSARITIARCVGGAFAKLILRQIGISIQAYVSQVGNIALEKDYRLYDLSVVERNDVRCPDAAVARQMEELILKTKAEGDTIGGTITCVIKGCPAGLGEPEFDKLHARLGYAMLGINAVKGFEYGDGFDIVSRRGSEVNDVFVPQKPSAENVLAKNVLAKNVPAEGALAEDVNQHVTDAPKLSTLSNHSGGIQGGISNGQDIFFRVAFKPVATILMPQNTVDLNGQPADFTARGRHDSCVVPRAVPIVEAMSAMVLLDFYLTNRASSRLF